MENYSLTLSHPWHGISPGENTPDLITVFIEMLPTDTVKYEVDKKTGHLNVDRPQKYSNLCPSLYGFLPKSYCGEKTAEFAMQQSGKLNIQGDLDPLDICVLTERPINHGYITLEARPIGGFRMFDGGEADDKIIAILDKDPAYSGYHDITDVPKAIIDRLRHYFLTYKQTPDNTDPTCIISEVYGAAEAKRVIELSVLDYQDLLKNRR